MHGGARDCCGPPDISGFQQFRILPICVYLYSFVSICIYLESICIYLLLLVNLIKVYDFQGFLLCC